MPKKTSLEDLEEKPLAKVFDTPRSLRLELDEDESRPEHSHPGTEIVLFVHEGAIEMSLDGEIHSVEKGEALQFSGNRDISSHAVKDSVAVLVFFDVEDGG